MVSDYRAAGLYSPIEQVRGRVKTIASILDKANRKGVELEDIEDRIDDIAGIRLICQFEVDIMAVVKIIRQMSDLEIVSETDYINHPKASGYRSYHVNVLYDVETIYGHKKIKVEIQIRTLAMNFWSVIEHSLHYKYNGHIPEEIETRLIASAKAVQALDFEMASIREDVINSQNMFQKESGSVADILNNLQNLYKVADKEDMLALQREFYQIYRGGDKEALLEYGRKIDEMAANKKAQKIR
jgi:putative GTP pyrophosphokinase